MTSATTAHSPSRHWQTGSRIWSFERAPLLMGIVNVTPDSFSDGGKWLDPKAAVDHALQLVADGADVLDLGGESTRPGSLPVPADEQLRRLLPVVATLRDQTDCPLSVDTFLSQVARETLAAGASIVNDITGLTGDPRMVEVCAESDCGVIAMHMQGTPATMQDDPRYDNVVAEVTAYLAGRLTSLEQAGIARERVMIDPGIGFGKTAAHNLELLAGIRSLHQLNRPVLIGHSRKRFLQKVLGRPVEEVLAGTIGVSIALAMQGVEMIRVHDVKAVRDALQAWQAVAPNKLAPA